MKCIISRTSDGFPCDGAVREKVAYVDGRTVDDPKKLMFPLDRESWYKFGENHRVENGHIFRDIMEDGYTIEVESLVSFIKEHGECVVSVDNLNQVHIEIYDDYRE